MADLRRTMRTMLTHKPDQPLTRLPRRGARREVAALLMMMIDVAEANDETKYPHLKGQGTRFIVQGIPGQPLEFIVTPETTYIIIAPIKITYVGIFTDGPNWPGSSGQSRGILCAASH